MLQPLPLLTETELISIMDQQGIGTDATIASHIKKIVDRQFVVCVYPRAPTLCSSCIGGRRHMLLDEGVGRWAKAETGAGKHRRAARAA